MTKEDFWKWFEGNRGAIEHFILERTTDYSIYEMLSEKLNQYSEFLIPELTQTESNQLVFVISCDGDREGIPFVEELANNAKISGNWLVVKYRQPGPMELIPFNGLNLKRREIFLTWDQSSSKKHEITFYVRGYTPQDSRYQAATILHLDHTIGEYNAMTRIAKISFRRIGIFQSTKNLKTLDDLKAELDERFPCSS